MNRDDIICMAREAGICMGNSILLPAPDGEVEALARFAALVAAHEREACGVRGGAAAMAGLNYMEVADAIRKRGEVKP